MSYFFLGGNKVCHNFNILLCSEQPAQTAAMRAELHRRSIAQMRVSFVKETMFPAIH